MDRTEMLNHIGIEVEKLICLYGRRRDITVTFSKLTDRNITEFSEWDRKRFHLMSGGEWFFVWENCLEDISNPRGLLYAVDVTADSPLTAASEIMNLAARKF